MNYLGTTHRSAIERLNNSFKHKLQRIQKQEQFKRNNNHRYEKLTQREVEVVILLANGYNNPQIANMLFISRFTVEQHRKNINKKLGTHSFADLYQYALAFNLI